jgi:hypothetical protein
LGYFEFFDKIRGESASEGAPPVSMTLVANLTPLSTPAANFTTGNTGVVDTFGKLCEQYQTADTLK